MPCLDCSLIDWTLRETVRAHLRVLVKRILGKHGYPPDKQDKATQTVLEQAEVPSEIWAEDPTKTRADGSMTPVVVLTTQRAHVESRRLQTLGEAAGDGRSKR